MSFEHTPLLILPSMFIRIVLGFDWSMHCDASAISTSDVPMPKATQPIAPWVEVWLSPAYDRHTRLRKSGFRPHDVYYAVAVGSDAENFYTRFAAVLNERFHLRARKRIGRRQFLVFGRYVVVGAGSNLLRAEYFGSAPAKALESLGACYFVDVLTVDVKDARATFECFHSMRIPDFIE